MSKPLKTKTVHFRLTMEEYRELVNVAKAMRTDKSGALREILKYGGLLMAKAINEGKLVPEFIGQQAQPKEAHDGTSA